MYANCRLCPKIAYEWSGYFSYMQVLGHVAIACYVDYVWISDRIVNEAYHNEDIQKTVPIIGGCLYIAAGVLCGILNVSAALRYRLLVKSDSLPRSVSNQDVRLLVHSILLLCFLSFRAVYHAVVFLSTDGGNASLAATALSVLPAVTDGYSLLGSVFLVSISTPVREGYARFYRLKRSNVTKVFSLHDSTLPLRVQ
ncbi:hypothetical protein AAVH_23647 [Aphelenchoides avenae]|nr:hypothetical protein AAVH_23647 [Aphelenchus avenae]